MRRQININYDISRLPSSHCLCSLVLTSPTYKGHVQLLDGKPFCCLQVNGKESQDPSGSYRNGAEAFAVVQLIRQIRDAATRNSTACSPWNSPERLRVITFYQAQVSVLRKMCHDAFRPHDVVVATVDSSQGCEADIVIVSFVRNNSAGFLTDNRRMNVALTRAKYQLICVGNVEGMAKLTGHGEQSLKLLADSAEERQRVFEFQPSIAFPFRKKFRTIGSTSITGASLL